MPGTKTLSELLTHLYVLIPVFDNQKHYFVGEDELEKLLDKGAGWLASHPEKEQITRRYLKHRSSLYREALSPARDVEETLVGARGGDPGEQAGRHARTTAQPERTAARRRVGGAAGQRCAEVCWTSAAARENCCGNCCKDRQFERIVGMDVSVQRSERAVQRLGYDRLPPKQRERIELIHGSLIYRDKRLAGFDAAAVVEVIEHLDPPRLSAFERVLFEFSRPKTIVLTTPNREYNVTWETLPAGQFRHPDHRFEWTRQEFHVWAAAHCRAVWLQGAVPARGAGRRELGSPTQMGVFEHD